MLCNQRKEYLMPKRMVVLVTGLIILSLVLAAGQAVQPRARWREWLAAKNYPFDQSIASPSGWPA